MTIVKPALSFISIIIKLRLNKEQLNEIGLPQLNRLRIQRDKHFKGKEFNRTFFIHFQARLKKLL